MGLRQFVGEACGRANRKNDVVGNHSSQSAISPSAPLLRVESVSNEKLFEKVEQMLRRSLTPDERRFLMLANKVLGKEQQREVRKEKSAVAS